MKLSEIKAADVLAGKSWRVQFAEGEDGLNGSVSEAYEFTASDTGLVSAVVKFGDGSEHPALVVKSFPQNADDIDIYVHTKFGWLNIHASGFMRAVGKYSHEVFPFDYHLATAWKGGSQPQPDAHSPHKKAFQEAAARLLAAAKMPAKREKPV